MEWRETLNSFSAETMSLAQLDTNFLLSLRAAEPLRPPEAPWMTALSSRTLPSFFHWLPGLPASP